MVSGLNLMPRREGARQLPTIFLKVQIGGHDLRNFEPKKWLKFSILDKRIQELRAMYKAHPEWFDVPKPKSDKGKSEVDYPSILSAINSSISILSES